MIQQLINRLMDPLGPNMSRDDAAALVLTSDPFDLVLHMEQVWAAFQPWGPPPNPQVGPGRLAFLALGSAGPLAAVVPPPGPPCWDHLGYSYVLENTRAVQIFSRVIREYRSGEGLGTPSVATQRWLDITEMLLFGAASPISPWLSTSLIRPDPEAVRRNAYWRLFGLDLAFGTDENRAPAYDKAKAANTNFVRLFEELLFEVWQAMANVRNTSGSNVADADRIFRLAEVLQNALRSRRQVQTLGREELAAATALGWVDLTLSANTPVVEDLEAEASSPSERLRLMGQRVGLSAHSKASSLFSMAGDLSVFLRTIELGVISGPQFAWLLYDSAQPGSIANSSQRVITEWAAATGKDLKVRANPVEMRPAQAPRRPQLVASR
jgi:hypothetical protein